MHTPEILLLVERGLLPAVTPDMLRERGGTVGCELSLESGESGITLSRKSETNIKHMYTLYIYILKNQKNQNKQKYIYYIIYRI